MSTVHSFDDDKSTSVTELVDAIFVSVIVGNNKTLPPYLKGYRPGKNFKATLPITMEEETPHPPPTKESGTSTTNESDIHTFPPDDKDKPST